jgi:hypothetical protein
VGGGVGEAQIFLQSLLSQKWGRGEILEVNVVGRDRTVVRCLR